MSNIHDDGERPRKRRMIEGDRDDVLRTLLYEEIDLEIGLRTRLKETVESRLTWALVLQDALEKQFELPEGHENKDGPNQFADMAIAAYKATNASAELFFPIEPPRPLNSAESTTPAPRINEPGRSPVLESHRPRHPPRPHVQLHHEDRVVREPNKFLFLRDVTATPTMVYKIACPDCHRSDFPRLQGLLNHCRLKHHREFASHDECVQACAVVVPEEEQSLVIERGLEVLGMSASLQRLFKMAVGSYEGIVAVPRAEEAKELAKVVRSCPSVKAEEEEREEPAFVTRTLGHHKDTPALAPFLGRTPRKRQIQVYDDDRPLDVVSIIEGVAMRSWRLPYCERSLVGKMEEVSPLSEDDEVEDVLNAGVSPKRGLKTFEGSRFHIPIRLIVSDYSLRLPDAEAKQTGLQVRIPTHKWIISVTTASYSLHISTVLAKMSVTCATGQSQSPLIVPLTVSEPPFCVMGSADESFLAHITLQWIGMRNKPTQLEHWVQLHEGKAARPVKGDEQILDIELDRHTEVIPQKDDSWKVNWSTGIPKATAPNEKISEIGDKTEPELIQRLKKILHRFPMTAQDAGSRKVPEVPYFLPLTTQHFLSLVEGRRKATEWGRARAIWEAFASSAPEKDRDTQETQPSDSVVKISGPVGVYRWMKAEGHFLDAASKSSVSAKPHKPTPDVFCAFCGLRSSAHRKGKTGRAKDGEEGGSGRVCEQPSWVGKMPIIDMQDILAYQPQTVRRRVATEPFTRDALAQLLQKTDPALILGIQRVVSVLHLPCLASPWDLAASDSVPTEEQRETEVVPYAVLAASVRRLIRLLVSGGIQAMEMRSEGSAKQSIPQSSASHGSKRRLLAPVHIARGLVEGAKRKSSRDIHRALLLAMARLGIIVRDAAHDAQPREAHPDGLDQVATDATIGTDQGQAYTSEIK